jgi:hypothetical protein
MHVMMNASHIFFGSIATSRCQPSHYLNVVNSDLSGLSSGVQ